MYSFLLEFFCFLQLFSPVPSFSDPIESVPAETETSVLADPAGPAGDFVDLMEMIRDASPGLYRRLCRMPRQALLESLMRALDSCVEAEPDIGDSAVSSRKIEVFPGRLLEEKRVFYLRADGLTEETLSGAKDEILQSLTASPAAMILDLRNASSGDSEDEFAHVIRFLGLLTEESKISPWYSSRPFAVLISGKTSGAAALLASLLVPSFAEAFTVGEATSGSCFPSVTETACGFRWHFPWIPEVLADTKTPTGPLEPVFRVPGTSGQIDFRKLGDEQSVSADKVLRTALDLTISLSVLKDRGPSAAK